MLVLHVLLLASAQPALKLVLVFVPHALQVTNFLVEFVQLYVLLLLIVPLAQLMSDNAILVLLTITGRVMSVSPVVMVNMPPLDQLPQLPQLPASLAMIATVLHVQDLDHSNAQSVAPTPIWTLPLAWLALLEHSELPLVQFKPLIVMVLVLMLPIVKLVLTVEPLPVLPVTQDSSWTQPRKLAVHVMILNVILVLALLQDNAQFAKILLLTLLSMVSVFSTLSLLLTKSKQLEESLPALNSMVLLPCLNPWVERAFSLIKWLLFSVLKLTKLESTVLRKVQSLLDSQFSLLIPQ